MSKWLIKRTLTLDSAKQLIGFAIEKAIELGVEGAIAVVDDGGHLICLERLDGTMAAAANIAIGKAATAVCFKRPGFVLENAVSTERVAMRTLGNATSEPFVPLMGAYPILINGEIVGGISVAGAENGTNDEKIVKFTMEEFMKTL